jgi:hypothetical protein
MKPIHLLLGVLLASSILQAQTISQVAATVNPSPGNYIIGESGANDRVWQKVTQETDNQGNITYQTNQAYVELATGLNHLVNGQWVASKEEIDISPDGSSAAATNGQHQVYFPGDIYNGVIKLVTPDGQTLQSQPIGLSYFDGSTSVLLAVVTNSTGAILRSGNQVIYTNAFAGLNADLLYTYTKAGAEQDIILREQPPDPAVLGLNPATTRIQVFTEFFNPPQPAVTATTVSTAAGNLEDDYLSFGAMQIGQGKAFLLGTNSPVVSVEKRWVTLNGNQFLIEEVPIVSIAGDVDALPPFVGQAGLGTKPVLTKNLQLPQRRLVHAMPKSRFVAQAAAPKKGLVLDYMTLNYNTNAFTFQGDTTYYISGTVNLTGTNTFEGGAVIKYTNGATINMSGASASLVINWLTDLYRPVIMTARDDNTEGDTISGSSGSPSGYYANPALEIQNASAQTLSNFRIAYARQAILVSDNGAVSFYNGQLINCQNAVTLANSPVYLRNVLFADIITNFDETASGTGDVQNATFNDIEYLSAESANNALTLNLTNCVLANVTNLFAGTYTNAANAGTNGFYNCPAFGSGQVTNTSPPFQSVGAGNYYLASGCAFTNGGTTNIDPVLLADLQQTTIYPPLVISNAASSWTGTNLTPQVTRDLCNPPALGYHYDPLDYLVTGLSAFPDDDPIMLTNGVAVGLFGNYGFVLNEVCKFISVGKANAMNRIVWYPSVQEEPILLANIGTSGSGIFNVSGATSTAGYIPKPQIILRFTDLPMLGTRQNFFYNYTYTYNLNTVSMQDCWVRGVSLTVGGYYAAYTNATTAIFFLDNLFERSSVSLYNGYVLQCQYCVFENPLSLTAYNNLFWQSAIGLTYLDSQSWIHPNWTIKDNLFDTTPTSLYADGNWSNYVSTANNAYSGTSDIVPGTNDINPLTNLSYAVGPLGPWYINSASPTLLYAGSRSAASAGLYHYTIQTNLQNNCEVPDGTNTVSIGFHYVAVDQYGNPLDSNGDGIPDYLEDANGDGIYDTGDPGNWQGLNLNVIITRPRNGSILP